MRLVTCIMYSLHNKLFLFHIVVETLAGDRITVGAKFSSLVQKGPGDHSTFCTVGTGSFPGVKGLERGVDHPAPFSAEVKEIVELHHFSPSVPSWPVPGRNLRLPYCG
jgi:hypothetical protein